MYRILPVAQGELGSTDLGTIARAARNALLIETETDHHQRERRLGRRHGGSKEGGRWQQLLTRAHRDVILEEHTQ